QDLDGYGLTNLEEYRLGTNMRSRDTDGDGISDLIEVRMGLNPLVADPATTLQGRVVDSVGAAVQGASVLILGYFNTATDATGAFTLTYVPAGSGPLTVQVSKAIGLQFLLGSTVSAA